MQQEEMTGKIKRIKPKLLRLLKRNTKNGSLFGYKHISEYLSSTDIYTLKMCVKELISEGIPIIHVKKNSVIGLKICETMEELNKYVENLNYKINREIEKRDAVISAFKQSINKNRS